MRDEIADLITAEDFDMIVGRVRSQLADIRQVVLCYNPPVRQHWLPQRFFQGGKIMPEFNKPYYFSQPYTNPFTNKTEHLHTIAIRTHYKHNAFLDAESAGYYQTLKDTNPEMYISLDRAEWGDNAIGIIFNKKYYDEKQAPAGITGVIYCDPNIGLKEQADTTAIVKIGFDWNTETFYVVDAFCERVSDSTVTLDRVLDMYDDYFDVIGFDGTMTGEGIWTNIIRNSKYDNRLSPKIEYKKYSIDECAKSVQVLYNSGKIKFPVGFEKTKMGELFLEQMYRFKGKRWTKTGQKDDAPDALIGAIMLAVERKRARIPSIQLKIRN